ncbi:MAG: hypothetical protein Q4F31_02345 [Eubacteriales bacterium]|nr:hypothetical protein [Eubacteriales bacterium]
MNNIEAKYNIDDDIRCIDAFLSECFTISDTTVSLYASSEDTIPGIDEPDFSFSERVLQFVEQAGMTPKEFYSKANLTRQVFHVMNSNRDYRPTRTTAFACAIGLELSLEQTKELLMSAGYAFSHSLRTDIVVEYYIRNRIYDIDRINNALFHYDLQVLGSA